LLANVYLHDVVDEWVEQEVKPHLQGQVFLLRDRDDVVMGVTRETDAQQVREALSMRVSQYGLALHPEKTRMIPFHGPAQHAAEQGGGAATRPGTFEWLGFYSLLGTIPERELGGEAPDAPPTDVGVRPDCPLVSGESAPTAQGATGHAGAEAPGP